MANRRIAKKRRTEAEKFVQGSCGENGVLQAAEQTEVSKEINLYIQYQGMELVIREIEEKIQNEWTAQGKEAADLQKMDVYIKPEEKKAYYVINEQDNGCIQL